MDTPTRGPTRLLGSLDRLTAELERAFRQWEAEPNPWPEERVNELACRAFLLQRAGNGPYGRYCQRLEVAAEDVTGWREVPPVPTAAFREIPLTVGRPQEAKLDFRTSGTTGGTRRRGRHLVRAPGLYRASLEATFTHFVLTRTGSGSTDPGRRLPIASLVPDYDRSRHSSLSWMAEAVLARFGSPGSQFLATDRGIDWEAAASFASSAAARQEPVCLFGTTLAFDEWSRRLDDSRRRIALPKGSIVVDTGGSKGRVGLERDRVLERLESCLGVGEDNVVNEFGMTELLSQRYGSPAVLLGPPWLRSRALDPVTLEELPEGEVGVLNHFDLANVGSVCSVLTEDLGSVADGVLTLVGRATGSSPRGCSLATAELLRAQATAGP